VFDSVEFSKRVLVGLPGALDGVSNLGRPVSNLTIPMSNLGRPVSNLTIPMSNLVGGGPIEVGPCPTRGAGDLRVAVTRLELNRTA
jgi:hypothetical protein